MGCLVLWHRLSFLADTIGHAAILGVAIAMLFEVNPYYGVVFISITVAVLIVRVQQRHMLLTDSILAIVSQVGMAAGILILALESKHAGHVHLEDLLFGDIAELSSQHLILLVCVALTILVVLKLSWKKLLLISMSWEISQAEGLSVQKNRLMIYLLMALMISALINIMGVLLIAALLIIPPTAVRWFSTSPEKMVVFTFVFVFLSMLIGLWYSFESQILSGPTIVLAAAFLLIISQITKKLLNRH